MIIFNCGFSKKVTCKFMLQGQWGKCHNSAYLKNRRQQRYLPHYQSDSFSGLKLFEGAVINWETLGITSTVPLSWFPLCLGHCARCYSRKFWTLRTRTSTFPLQQGYHENHEAYVANLNCLDGMVLYCYCEDTK